jgi:hypothetical protein
METLAVDSRSACRARAGAQRRRRPSRLAAEHGIVLDTLAALGVMEPTQSVPVLARPNSTSPVPPAQDASRAQERGVADETERRPMATLATEESARTGFGC